MMQRFALIILTDEIKIKTFEHKDDFITARQTLVAKKTKFVPLKWHDGAGIWTQPEVCE